MNAMPRERRRNGRYQRSLTDAERDAEVVRLRAQQYTFDEIATELGYKSRAGAYAAYKRALAEVVREPAEEVIKQETEKYDLIEREAWEILRETHPLVSHGRLITVDDEDGNSRPLEDAGPKLAAADRLLKVAERRAKLLGLDTPVKVDATVQQVDARDAELTEMINEARAAEHESGSAGP